MYSLDLRTAALRAYGAMRRPREVAALLHIGHSPLARWVKGPPRSPRLPGARVHEQKGAGGGSIAMYARVGDDLDLTFSITLTARLLPVSNLALAMALGALDPLLPNRGLGHDG